MNQKRKLDERDNNTDDDDNYYVLSICYELPEFICDICNAIYDTNIHNAPTKTSVLNHLLPMIHDDEPNNHNHNNNIHYLDEYMKHYFCCNKLTRLSISNKTYSNDYIITNNNGILDKGMLPYKYQFDGDKIKLMYTRYDVYSPDGKLCIDTNTKYMKQILHKMRIYNAKQHMKKSIDKTISCLQKSRNEMDDMEICDDERIDILLGEQKCVLKNRMKQEKQLNMINNNQLPFEIKNKVVLCYVNLNEVTTIDNFPGKCTVYIESIKLNVPNGITFAKTTSITKHTDGHYSNN